MGDVPQFHAQGVVACVLRSDVSVQWCVLCFLIRPGQESPRIVENEVLTPHTLESSTFMMEPETLMVGTMNVPRKEKATRPSNGAFCVLWGVVGIRVVCLFLFCSFLVGLRARPQPTCFHTSCFVVLSFSLLSLGVE